MKRKIEDYKDQKVAIHCSTKEEWDKIVDLFPSNRSVKKNYWQNSVNNGKSDTIRIDGYGWSPKKYYEDEGYTIYPVSDFLEEIKSISKMETFSKQNLFKFNIGDEIKAKPGGYFISSPQHFAEIHKKLFPSEKSTISGTITERTQAQGFNWYKCSYGGNWITEEGVELIKEDVPEYVEYIDTKYKGQIVKVEEWTNHSFCCIRFENGQREQPFKNLVNPSTKEAFDLQNKLKTISEDVFCIELNSQEELDAIMDFYKQKGFRERGNSQEYYGGYVVYINVKDKEWQTSVRNDWNYPVKTLSELGIEVKSKSLFGRYLKALVNYPDAGSVLKGEIGIITKEYNGIPLEVDFPSQKYYGINDFTYKKRKSYELMPEGFKLEDDLIVEEKLEKLIQSQLEKYRNI